MQKNIRKFISQLNWQDCENCWLLQKYFLYPFLFNFYIGDLEQNVKSQLLSLLMTDIGMVNQGLRIHSNEGSFRITTSMRFSVNLYLPGHQFGFCSGLVCGKVSDEKCEIMINNGLHRSPCGSLTRYARRSLEL